mmetsp:Transcript_54205/g.115708  ORF Transcript_54205/g.115708 Transcript_54205/m.115708 type:complete len:300 (+) Transcript_54205:108-1007(+)|eukprot:CAMPEP_0206481506 /NCGR_PEP_ID=MMETSP0324_2-20121206/38199_1 /ASSEMBLY_ACC=CAM_ASM_000836 /TAXON_ID=2866 /ORGANISM="Crypthecodinium cohnii, Strain Seligo" /LENGTH=299 /DNA_ID=CAMNT_0053959035 /DNA_START=88 /DNA_END=987 /DNA_ORIENTATION=+
MRFLRHFRFFTGRSSSGVQSISSEDPDKPAPAPLEHQETHSTVESEDMVVDGDSDAASQPKVFPNGLATHVSRAEPDGADDDDDEIEIIETEEKVQDSPERARTTELWSEKGCEEDYKKDEFEKGDEDTMSKASLDETKQGLACRSSKTRWFRQTDLPGSMEEADDVDLDQYFLDQFLEGSGLEFSAQGNARAGLHLDMPGNQASAACEAGRSASGSVGITMEDSVAYLAELQSLEEDHLRLEAELLNMGLELDELDEQQALLCSLQEQWEFEADKEVAVLLESLQDLSMSSYCSVEVC